MSYRLPEYLQQFIEELSALKKLSGVKRAAERLIASYQSTNSATLVAEEDFLAYLIYRFPATFAVNGFVLREIARLLPEFAPTSIVDVGAGPGTASAAAKEFYPTLTKYTLLEQQKGFLDIARRLFPDAVLLSQKVEEGFPQADLIVASYVLSELSEKAFEPVVDSLHRNAKQVAVLIEPGSKSGFTNILKARELLLKRGATLIAPCPHQKGCPMPCHDWCHFSCRLERSRFHTFVKEASCGFEDEKFSYLVVAKTPLTLALNDRIIFPPIKKSGHILFRVCSTEGTLEQRIVSRRHGPFFSLAKKLQWGENLPSFEG